MQPSCQLVELVERSADVLAWMRGPTSRGIWKINDTTHVVVTYPKLGSDVSLLYMSSIFKSDVNK